MFTCTTCKYSTNIKSRMILHNDTNKHKLLCSGEEDITNKFSECKFCKKMFL